MYYALVIVVVSSLTGIPEPVHEQQVFEFLTKQSCEEVGEVMTEALVRDVNESDDQVIQDLKLVFTHECREEI